MSEQLSSTYIIEYKYIIAIFLMPFSMLGNMASDVCREGKMPAHAVTYCDMALGQIEM